jgi:nicotinate dehydrogenase subunit A
VKVDDERMLLWVLRSDLGLTGTKFGCGEALCGACTVIVDKQAVRSCSTPVKDVAGKQVLTIEGLGQNGLHAIQQAFLKHNAFQCGFCTPGMILTAYALLLKTPKPTEEQILRHMEDNLCRCGAHVRIVDAFRKPPAGQGRCVMDVSRRGFLALAGPGLFVFFGVERVSAYQQEPGRLPGRKRGRRTSTPTCASAPMAASPASPARWSWDKAPERAGADSGRRARRGL